LLVFLERRGTMEHTEYLNMIRDIYARLHSMVQEQLELLSQDRFAEFLALCSRVQGLQEQLSTLTKKFMTTLPRDSDESRIKDTKAQISSLQKLIERLYGKMEQLIAEKKKTLRGEVGKLKKGQMAIRGYSSHDKKSPRFVEKVT